MSRLKQCLLFGSLTMITMALVFGAYLVTRAGWWRVFAVTGVCLALFALSCAAAIHWLPRSKTPGSVRCQGKHRLPHQPDPTNPDNPQ